MLRFGPLLFLSAFLLFGVQPLMGAWALPVFGGGPAIWTACMLFFQAALLGGYGYAHVLASRVPVATQARVHVGLVVVVLLFAWGQALFGAGPLVPSPSWRDATNPTLGVLGLLATTVGPVFFVLAASAPLFQSWFTATSSGGVPWRLYALSNAGSLVSLLSFPFVVEPLVGRTAQAWAFLVLFTSWSLLVVSTARSLAPAQSPDATKASTASSSMMAPVLWLTLSAIANIVLVATTQRLSEDVAAGPLQWLLPLSLYLVTFILCFEKPGWYLRGAWLSVLGVSSFVSALSWVGRWDSLSLQVALSSLTLFSACMVCHGELYRLRPTDSSASGFYLFVSAGGVVGGLFVSLVAPRVFTSFAEYPLGLGAACVVGVIALASLRRKLALVGAVGLIISIGAIAVGWEGWRRSAQPPVFEGRNFFGVLRVESIGTKGTNDHEYAESHGRITHGWQYQAPARRREVSGYFSHESGVGRAIAALRTRGSAPLSVGVLGLGVGQLANFGNAGDSMRFYEINPLVVSLAQGEGGFFSVLGDSAAAVDVVLGDARISLEREPPSAFDLLVVDVFTGDSIPPHLLTAEAFALYQRHLRAGRGVIAVHITNRYLNLEPVLAGHAKQLGLSMRVVRSVDRGGAPSVWGVLAADPSLFDATAFQSNEVSPAEPHVIAWTDEHHSLLPLLLAR